MPILYKFITAVLAVTGCTSLILTGSLNPLMTISGLALLPGYFRFLKGRLPAPKWAVGTFSLLTLLVFLADSVMISGDVFLAVAHLTITFQAIKSFDLKEPWDHLQVYFMSLLQLIIASELTRSLMFGVMFVFFMLLLVTAMVLSHFLKENALGKVAVRKPVTMISLLVLFMTLLIFLFVPRTSQKFLGKSHAKAIKTAGFSEKVDFGSFGEVKLDPTIVMRIETEREIYAPYWRGMTLDYFDGMSWRNTASSKYRISGRDSEYRLNACDAGSTTGQRIYLEPIDSDIIFGLPKICTVRSEGYALSSDYGQALYLRGKSSRRVKYSLTSVDSDSYEGTRTRNDLQLPSGQDRIAALAKRITARAGSDEQKAVLIEQHLKTNYAYSLQPSRPPAGVSPIEDFLFNSRKGYCEYYATAMVVMLRSLDIPSRVVTGYYGGERNEYGGYIIVRQSDAHSWVEALIKDRWKRFDPTPAVPVLHPSSLALFFDSLQLNWTRYVVGFSAADQQDIISWLSVPFSVKRLPGFSLIPLIVLGSVVAAGVLFFFVFSFAARSIRRRKYGFLTERYLSLRRLLNRKGVSVKQSLTAGEVRRMACHLGMAEDLDAFLQIYEKHRFGNGALSPEERIRYETLLEKIKKRL